MNSSDKEYVVEAEKAIEWIYLGDIFVAVWNKIYKMSFLRNNGILFDEKIWYGEGMLFNIDCLQFVDRVTIVIEGEKGEVHWCENEISQGKTAIHSQHGAIYKSIATEKFEVTDISVNRE